MASHMAKSAVEILESNPIKRVAALYRVSTKKQLNPSENGGDIPTQQKACHDFVASKPNWTIVKEYYEKGVSGFKITASNRDVIQDARRDAEMRNFDILLVFKFDRLGRLDDETPFVLQWFVKKGIEMWSVVEGQQKIEDQMDKLINFLTFWQANTESVNTSIRVNEAHKQMVEAGVFRGGAIPYGYRTKPSGRFNKKGKELLELEIEADQADVVRMMYRLVVEEGYGQNRIAKLLNQKGIKTGKGNTWSSSVINAMIKNPTYKGYFAYAKRTDKEVLSKEKQVGLAIVDEATWQRTQEIRAKRNPENTVKNGQECVIRSTKSSLLLIGMARCGHCGNALTTTWNKKTYTRSDGTVRSSRYAKYRCVGKALQKVECAGQTAYSQVKLESIVLSQVYTYLDRLATVDLSARVADMQTRHAGNEEKELRKWTKQSDVEQDKLTKYKAEVIRVISGESKFSSEMLNELIHETKQRILALEDQIRTVQNEMASKKVEETEIKMLQEYVPVWREVFEQASDAKKKMMLGTIIGSIRVYRDRIEINFKLRIDQFLGTMGYGAAKPEYFSDGAMSGRVLTEHSVARNA